MGARSFVGIGEAAYATISPALLSDYFPRSKRGRAFAIFYVAIQWVPLLVICLAVLSNRCWAGERPSTLWVFPALSFPACADCA